MLEQVAAQFNEAYLSGIAKKVATLPDEDGATLMNNLILEELQELNEAFDNGDLVEVCDALGDIIYVVAQQAHLWGIPIDALFREIHRSNMSKLGADGKPIIIQEGPKKGKVGKGPEFTPPNIIAILNTQKAFKEHDL